MDNIIPLPPSATPETALPPAATPEVASTDGTTATPPVSDTQAVTVPGPVTPAASHSPPPKPQEEPVLALAKKLAASEEPEESDYHLPTEADLRELVDGCAREQLKALYDAGDRLRVLVNERWAKQPGQPGY